MNLSLFLKLSPHQTDRRVLDIVSADKGWLTQIRGCAEHTVVAPPPEGVDVIGMVPQGEVVVKEFIVMSGLEEVAWLEENITKEKCPDGFIVVEPNGSRLSHIYAHCRAVGVPYVITESVTVGLNPLWVGLCLTMSMSSLLSHTIHMLSVRTLLEDLEMLTHIGLSNTVGYLPSSISSSVCLMVVSRTLLILLVCL